MADLSHIKKEWTPGTERDLEADEAAHCREWLADHVRDVILFIQRDNGRIFEANAAAMNAYGYSREELLKLTIHDLRAPETRGLIDDQMAEADGRGILFESVHQRKDGSTFPVEVNSRGATLSGRRTLISVVRDITYRKRAERDLKDYAEGLTFLSDIAIRMLGQSSLPGLLKIMADRIYSIADGAAVIISEFDLENRKTIIREVRSTSEEREKVLQVLGSPLEGLAFDFLEETRIKFMPGEIALVKGGLHELSFEQIPVPICNFLEQTLNLGDIFAMACAYEKDLLGTVVVLTHGRGFPRKRRLIESLVNQAALVFKRLRAEEALQQRSLELQQLNETLEERVRERTADLADLSSQLVSAQENERRRVSYDLHDNAWQTLLAIRFEIEQFFSDQSQKIGGALDDKSNKVMAAILDVVGKIRSMQGDLWPYVLDDIGILATLDWYCREFEKSHAGLAVERKSDLVESEIPSSVKIVIYRILQEALSNIDKHSRADQVWLRLIKNAHQMELTIEDNGIGFDPEERIVKRAPWGGLGLLNIKARTELSGGLFGVESVIGKGTTVRASWSLG